MNARIPVWTNIRAMSLLACSLLCVLVLFVFFPSQIEAAWQPSLEIGVQTGEASVDLRPVRGDGVLFLQDDNKIQARYSMAQNIHVEIQGKGFRVNGKSFPGDILNFKVEKKGNSSKPRWNLQGKSYRGNLRIMKRGTKLVVVNILSTEDYLRGTVGKEMPPDWNEEALKAQAVAARTFALKNRKRHAKEGFDLCNTTHCQVYGGADDEHLSVDHAVLDTYGEVLTYQGKLIEAVFHTDSGGMTEYSRNVWGTDVAYLAPAKEEKQKTMSWNENIPVAKLDAVFAKNGLSIGSLKRIELTPLTIGKESKDRFQSGRIKSAKFVGDKGTVNVSGNKLREMFAFRSTLFDMHLSHGTISVQGYGRGHGLGLSQHGAQAFAKKGMKYDEILKHYYRGVTIKKLFKLPTPKRWADSTCGHGIHPLHTAGRSQA